MKRDTVVPTGGESASRDPDERTVRQNDVLLDRRSYLKLTGATAAAGVAATTAAGAAGDEYDEITVGAGETYRKDISNGETWENVLIDITAPNAKFRITAHANNFTIRNLGIRGQWEDTNQSSPFTAFVPNPNASATIENYCWADGDAGDGYPRGATGLFVASAHAGHIDIRNVNLQGFADNAIYASSMGNPNDHPSPGAGGTVAIEDSYCADCYAAGFRLGTDGSYVKNCVMYNVDRAYTGFFGRTEVIDSDMIGGKNLGQDISIGGGGSQGQYTQTDVEVTVTNSRFDMDNVHYQTSWANPSLNGEPVGPAERTEPDEVEGVPLSPEEAASGAPGLSADRSDDTDTEETEDVEDDETESTETASDELPHVLLFDGAGTSEPTAYSFTVDGEVAKADYMGASIDDDDIIDGNTVRGVVANWRDAYRFSGDITDFKLVGHAAVSVEYDI